MSLTGIYVHKPRDDNVVQKNEDSKRTTEVASAPNDVLSQWQKSENGFLGGMQ